jgi:hypothetical protein
MAESTPRKGPMLEVEADFTGTDSTRTVQSCQRPLLGCDCKNPDGPNYPPDGKLHTVTNRKLQQQVHLCGPCYNYMMGKEGTVTRKREPVTQHSQHRKNILHIFQTPSS